MISGGATTYYHQDDQSVRLTTDVNGNVVSQQGTFPFGESWYSNLGQGDNWVFTSYDRDSESGLDYALARYYDSRTGTFCSADPLAGSPDDPQSWNRYPYGRNDPIDARDPSGKFFFFLFPLLEQLLPEMEQLATEAVLPQVVTTITVKATASLVPDLIASGLGGAGLTAAATATAGGKAPLNNRNLQRFQKAQQNAQNDLNNKDCQHFLSGQHINPQDLRAAIAKEVPWNGVKSSINLVSAGVLDPQDSSNFTPFGLAVNLKTPVSSLFGSSGPTITMALAQSPGHDVYFRPGGIFGSGGITPANVIHEGLHNLTGLGDPSLAAKLGLPGGKSQDINPILHNHHCF